MAFTARYKSRLVDIVEETPGVPRKVMAFHTGLNSTCALDYKYPARLVDIVEFPAGSSSYVKVFAFATECYDGPHGLTFVEPTCTPAASAPFGISSVLRLEVTGILNCPICFDVELTYSGGTWTGSHGSYSFSVRCIPDPDPNEIRFELTITGCSVTPIVSSQVQPDCFFPLIAIFGEIGGLDAAACCNCDGGATSASFSLFGLVIPRKQARLVDIVESPPNSGTFLKVLAFSESCSPRECIPTHCCDVHRCTLTIEVIGTGACTCLSGTYSVPFVSGGGGSTATWDGTFVICPPLNNSLDLSLTCEANADDPTKADYEMYVECNDYTAGTGFLTGIDACLPLELVFTVPLVATPGVPGFTPCGDPANPCAGTLTVIVTKP